MSNTISITNQLINSIVDYFKSLYVEKQNGEFKVLSIQIACYLMYKNVKVKIVNNDGDVEYFVKDFLIGTKQYKNSFSNNKYVNTKIGVVAKMIENQFNDYQNHYYDAKSIVEIINDYNCKKHNCDKFQKLMYA